MWFFNKKPTRTDEAVRAIHKETFHTIDKATQSIDRNTQSIDKLTKLLKNKDMGTSELFFLATPAGKQVKRKK